MQRIYFTLISCLVAPFILSGQLPFMDATTTNLPASAIGGNTMDVAVADLNGDGYTDIVLAKEFQRNRILFNDGTGRFTDASNGRLTNVNHDSEDIAIADYDGNGWLDIVFASEDDATHELYLNTGDGNFTEVSSRLPQFVSNAVVALDVNSDSHIDLIFGNAGQNRVLINDGDANFTDETAARLPSINDITQDLLLVDVDNDGDMDIAVGNENGNRLLINNGSGVFADETVARLPQGVNMETRKVSKGDINGDGYFDLFYSNMASVGGRNLQDRLYLNDGAGHFTDLTNTHLPLEVKHTFDAVFTDLNDDGHSDLIIGYLSGLMPGIFLNDGTGHYADETSAYIPATAAGNNIAIIVEDFNHDGKKDLYIGSFQQADRMYFFSGAPVNISIIENDKNGISIYPNPATSVINLELKKECVKDTVHLSLLDLGGQVIKTEKQQGRASLTFSLQGLPSGTYILLAHTKTCSLRERVVVE